MKTNIANTLCGLVLIALVPLGVSAATFTLQDDPSSGWGVISGLTFDSISGNTVTYHNLVAQNVTSDTLPDLKFAIPFLWTQNTRIFVTQYENLSWRNDLNGWYMANLSDGFTYSTTMTVQLSSPTAEFVPMGNIADLTGIQQLPLTEPCQSGSPSCQSSLPYQPETRQSTDAIPVISLGAFGPNESKTFDISFTFIFGDQRTGTLPIQISANTVSTVPLPATVWLLGWALGALCFLSPRRKD